MADGAGLSRRNQILLEAAKPKDIKNRNNWLNVISRKGNPRFAGPPSRALLGFRARGPAIRSRNAAPNWRTYTAPGTTRLANSVVAAVAQALMSAKTAPAAKSALSKQPPIVQRRAIVAAKANVTPAVAQAMNPSILASAITDLISAGIKKIPAPAAAAALPAPAPVARQVARGMDPGSLAAAITEMVRQGIKPRPEVIAPVLGNKVAAKNVAKVIPPAVLAAAIVNAVSKGLPVHPEAFGPKPEQVAAQLPSNAGVRARQVSGLVEQVLNRRPLKNFNIMNEKSGNRLVRRAKYKAAWRTFGVPPMPNNGTKWNYNARTKTWTQNKGTYQGAGNEPALGIPAPPLAAQRQTPSAPTLVLGPNGQPQGLAVPQQQANNAARRARQAAQAVPTPEVKKAAEKANAAAQTANTAAQTANAAKANNAANKASKAAANAATAAANAKPNNKNLAQKAANARKSAVTARSGNVIGGAITFSPNIKIQLGNLPRAAEAARNNPNKQANLEKLLANLRSKLPNNSQTRKTVNNLFKEPNKIPTANQIKKALAKSYSNMNINELIALRKTGKNKDKVEAALREQVQTQLRRIGRLGSSERGPMLASLYKSLPDNFKGGRALIERNLRTEMRDASRRSNGRYRLENIRRNFGSALPSSLRTEYKIAESRALREERGRSPYRGPIASQPLRQAPLRQNYANRGRLRSEGPLREGISENKYRAMRQEGPLPLNTSAPLPPNQVAAINRAGGHNAALNTIAAVPGGAPTVALAAQALNEANGNRALAIERGANPVALNAVVKLSGKPANVSNTKTLKAAAKNASYVIEGLHHRARAHKKRKKARPGVNLNALNNVINAVRKRKLISIVAHKVTKTNNIHENENRKKKAYKSLIKAKILKRPLANVARRAAKKRMAKK